jgi:hypothetical protein
MIAPHLEPKGLDRATPAIGDFYSQAARKDNAIRGSILLRDAILAAKGIAPPPRKSEPLPITALEVHAPPSCPHCGAPSKPNPTMVAHIQHTVAAYYGLHPSLMVSAQRRQSISHPRQIAMFLSSELTPKSLPEIGRRFGGRDHTTVMHAIKAVKARMATDDEIREDVEILTERLAA